ncbi:ABC transporter substrate-binding protein [Desulfonema magnum]|uniref:Periplasmic binding domain-containing protein n=1 Tax=Desulfonema magnum TaxID=45655 RepID=A0A975BJ53_9BACT|nr:ABC transporter substrate-binding protein [Desulfonema magnum]QTA86079.1 Periplasmic binding domain-containing protein [Desulfonema magnum]
MKNLTKVFTALIITCIFFNICFISNEVHAEDFYHLGVALPLTGTGAFYSKDGIDAIQLAVEEINARGGFMGKYPIKLFIRNTGTKPDAAVRETKAMIFYNNVRCVLGTYSSDCAMAIKPVAKEHGILHIAAISNSENITLKDFSPYTFSVVPNSFMQANAVALGVARLAKEKEWKKYVTIASDYEWGKTTQMNFVRHLKKVAPDLKLIKKLWPRPGENQFASYITEIMSLKPDFVYGSLASRDNMVWMNAAKTLNFFKKIPYPGSLISVSELISQADTIPRDMIGLCRAPFFAHTDVPMMKNFVKSFRAVYNRYPSDWAVMEYDAVYILKQGIEKAGDIDSEMVKNALTGLTVDTTRGKLFFRKIDNQLSCSSYLGVVADDPDYPFPVYKELIEIKGPDSWRSEKEILSARKE